MTRGILMNPSQKAKKILQKETRYILVGSVDSASDLWFTNT